MTGPEASTGADVKVPGAREGDAGCRLDAALAQRGLARSRTHAAGLIAAGLVSLNGRVVTRASARVSGAAEIQVAAADHYVSRAAHKLIAALDAFDVDSAGRVALDAGASTGGFSQVLLERGARLVLAVDVGHGQCALPSDDRLRVIEGCNVRDLTPEGLALRSGIAVRPDLVTVDLSFISLGVVLPALRATADPAACFVVLVKPQFEVGRGGIRAGVVRDPRRIAEAVARVLWVAWDCELGTVGVVPSPLVGEHGNREVLACLRAGAPPPVESVIESVVSG